MDRAAFASAGRWTLAVLVSAAIGAYVNSYLSRPRLQIQLHGISAEAIKPSELEQKKKIDTSADLAARVERSTWLPSFNPKSSIDDYMDTLEEIQTIASSVGPSIAEVRKDLSQWPTGQGGRDAAIAAFRFLRRYSTIFLGHIWGEVKREGVARLQPLQIDDSAPIFVPYRKDADGDFGLNIGVARLPIVWSTEVDSGDLTDELRLTAERIVQAVAYGDRDGLAAIRQEIDKILVEEASIEECRKLAEDELQRLSHWVVRATVTNAGGRPIAISPRGALYVHSKGREVQLPTGAEIIDRDIQLELEGTRTAKSRVSLEGLGSMDTKSVERSDEPIIIEGGKAVSVSLRTVRRIWELPESNSLSWLFREGSAPARIALLPLTGTATGAAAPEPAWSNDGQFTQLSFEKAFPETVEWGSSK